jgi:hypothetical protein
MRIGWCAAVGLAFAVAGAAAAAQSENSFNDALLNMTPRLRSARLANMVGYWCIGTRTFFMGVAGQGREAGFAYWSLSCLDSGSYAIQIDPSGQWVAIQCEQLAAQGLGRKCFKKF